MADRTRSKRATVDPITLEVLRHGFVAASNEMRINLMRTSYNPIIYEVLDFSVGVFDSKGDMIAQAAGLPIFLGNLGAAVKTIIGDVGRETIRTGDVYMINDTYTTGSHLNDVTVVSPVFAGGTLMGFTASRAHWLDMGGKSPGGSSDTTDVFQEGLRLRSIQLYKEGVVNRSVMQILHDNVRWPEAHMGDLRAQIAAARTGEARFLELITRFGKDTVQAFIDELLRQGEEAVRQAIAKMPDGVYEADGYLDNDGVGSEHIHIKAKVVISGDEMTVDLSGSSDQCGGPLNCGYAASVAGCRVALKCVTDPLSPVNEGNFAPLKVIAPPGSMFNVQPPGSAFLYGVSLNVLIDVILKALEPALVGSIPAAHYGDMDGFMIYGKNPETGRDFIQQEPEGGGWGAFPDRDGENVMIFISDGDTRNVPVEVVESKFPLRIERYELRQDSGGPGKFRGGLGHYRDYRVLADEAYTTAIMDREFCPPWGLRGGKAAASDYVLINPGAKDEKKIMKITGYRLKKGDLVSVRSGGGGGYGDPFERDPEMVRLDVVRELVSMEAAREQYGVVLDKRTLAVDEAATRRLRARR